MKIKGELYESMKADIKAVVDFHGADVVRKAGAGSETGALWQILNAVSHDRAYDDSHPSYRAGRKRILPFDGRPYCFYYAGRRNDSHVTTALRAIKKELGL